MKLNAAAVTERPSSIGILLLAGLATLFLAGSAQALDGIEIGGKADAEGAEEAGASGCPALIAIKYPFLSCAAGQIGQSDANEIWENSRQIPIGSDWTEGDAYWGPDLNQD